MKDKVVLITGGSSGIGKACALAFGQKGSAVVITGRNQERLDKAETELKSKNVQVLALKADVVSETDNQMVVEKTIEAFGRLDVLINNAGISMRSLFSEVKMDVFRKLMDVNFFGAASITQCALPYIIESKGSIVAMSSIAGKKGLPLRTGYTASKFALEGFMEALRLEMRQHKVHVLVACPSFTESNIRNTALSASGETIAESPFNESELMSADEVAGEIYKATVAKKRDLVLTTLGRLVVAFNKFVPKYVDYRVHKQIAQEKGSPLELN